MNMVTITRGEYHALVKFAEHSPRSQPKGVQINTIWNLEFKQMITGQRLEGGYWQYSITDVGRAAIEAYQQDNPAATAPQIGKRRRRPTHVLVVAHAEYEAMLGELTQLRSQCQSQQAKIAKLEAEKQGALTLLKHQGLLVNDIQIETMTQEEYEERYGSENA